MSLSGRFASRIRVAQRSLRTRPTTLRVGANQTRSILSTTTQLKGLTTQTNGLNSFNSNNKVAFIFRRNFVASTQAAPEDVAGEAATGEVSEDGSEESSEPNTKEEAASAEIEELKMKIKELETQSENFKKAALEYKAEVYNVRTRSLRDIENAKKFSIEKFAKEMLTIADNIDLSLKNIEKPGPEETSQNFVLLYQGMEMNQKTMATVFAKFDLVKAESMGVKFDVNMHEVLFQMPGEPGEASGIIKNVVRDGYWLKDRALRSAQVGVTQ